MDRGACQATVHVVSTSQTCLINWAHQLQWCGAMALSHQIFNFFGLTLNFSPNYAWFAGKEVRGRDLCLWRTGTNGHHLRSALLLFFFIIFLKEGSRWCLRDCVHKKAQDSLWSITHLFISWSEFTFQLAPELNCKPWGTATWRREQLHGGKKANPQTSKAREISSQITPHELFTVFLAAKSKQTFHLHQIYSRSFNCLL